MRHDDDRFAEAARLWDEGKYQKAMSRYQELLGDDTIPALARALVCEYLGRLHVGGGELAAAQEFLRRAIALDPTGVEHYVQLANCLCLADQQEEAWQLIRRLYRRHPAHPTVMHYVGKMLDERGQHARGLALMKKALHLDPHNGRMLADIAFSYLMHDNAGAAMVCCEQALAMNADDEVVRFVHDLASQCEQSSRSRQRTTAGHGKKTRSPA